MKFRHIFLFLIIICICFTLPAQYRFIRHEINKITLPSDSALWFDFSKKLNNIHNSGSLTVLHFGDSHIQGDYFTGEVRKNFMHYFEVKNPARGLTMPYKVAGTNGPDELFSNSPGIFEKLSIRKEPYRYFALTGYGISFKDTLCSITLKDTSNYRFNKVLVYHSPLKNQLLKINNQLAESTFKLSDSLQISEFVFSKMNDQLLLQITNSPSNDKTVLYALSFENWNIPVTYNSLGVNGATFGTFLKLQDLNKLLEYIKPDCIILSYGTNDAINRNIDTTLLKAEIVSCIKNIRKSALSIPIIFTTPGDFLVNKQINPRIATVARIIRDTAMSSNCGYWDFYNIMGGAGSVKDWYSQQLIFKDWVHLSKKGYRLQGDLFSSAFFNLRDL